jgi:hypothetical protein
MVKLPRAAQIAPPTIPDVLTLRKLSYTKAQAPSGFLRQPSIGFGCLTVGALRAHHRGRAGTDAVTPRLIAKPIAWARHSVAAALGASLAVVRVRTSSPRSLRCGRGLRVAVHPESLPSRLRRHPSHPERKRTSLCYQADTCFLSTGRSSGRKIGSRRTTHLAPNAVAIRLSSAREALPESRRSRRAMAGCWVPTRSASCFCLRPCCHRNVMRLWTGSKSGRSCS